MSSTAAATAHGCDPASRRRTGSAQEESFVAVERVASAWEEAAFLVTEKEQATEGREAAGYKLEHLPPRL
eukprot:2181039-Pyramimonas_sp.AAC.1